MDCINITLSTGQSRSYTTRPQDGQKLQNPTPTENIDHFFSNLRLGVVLYHQLQKLFHKGEALGLIFESNVLTEQRQESTFQKVSLQLDSPGVTYLLQVNVPFRNSQAEG